jgi:hypothetical protein
MKCALFPLLAFFVIASMFGKEPAPTVTFISPCECVAFHGVNRWVAKTDLTPVPSDKSAIQAITPSQIYLPATSHSNKPSASHQAPTDGYLARRKILIVIAAAIIAPKAIATGVFMFGHTASIH